MEKYAYHQWKKLSYQLTFTKESVEELSKLYIVAHQKVKDILREAKVNKNYDPCPDSEEQLQFLKIILEKLAQRSTDQYLSKLDSKMMDRYEKCFLDLMEMLQVVLMTDYNQKKLDVATLEAIQEPRRSDPHSLKSEIRSSEKRMKRTKSGKTINNPPSSLDSLRSGSMKVLSQYEHQELVKEKQKNLERVINGHIVKEGLTVNFGKKYENLNNYLQTRKEFADLLFSEKKYDSHNFEKHLEKKDPQIKQPKIPDMKKIFPQFNIKTKFLKPKVKNNILNVIFDVKKALLQEYHKANLQKMNEQNQIAPKDLNQKLFKKQKVKSLGSQSQTQYSSPQKKKRFLSTNRLIPTHDFNRTSFKSLAGTTKTSFKNTAWEQLREKKSKKHLENQIKTAKIPNY